MGLSLARPRLGRFRIRHAEAGVIGAALTVLLGIAQPSVFAVAARLLARPVLTIVSLMVITLVADQSGLFARLAVALARIARGNGRALFALLFLTGTLVGTIFTNDAAVLIFTPLVYHLVERLSGGKWTTEQKLPFYFAVLYVANLVGALVIANPINIVVASLFKIGFLEYARWMALPALVSVLVSFAGLWMFFGHAIPRRFERGVEQTGRDPKWKFQLVCSAVLLVTLAGLFSEAWTGIPTWAVAAGGAILLLVVQSFFSEKGIAPIVKGVGWDVIIFLSGMFVIGLGLRQAGLTGLIGDLLHRLSGGDLARMRLSSGVVAAVSSAIINNHPTADNMAWAIRAIPVGDFDQRLLAFAALVGGDLGPKMLPIGSLAAMMWFRILRSEGVEIPYSLYIRVGVPVTLAAVVLSLLTLNLECYLVR